MSGDTRIVVVTGTDTGVGKTVAAAALAAVSTSSTTGNGRVLVVKPVQTGCADPEPSDAETVARLTGCDTETLSGYDEPLAPVAAARRQRADLTPLVEHADRIRELATGYDTVIVEGAGGLLVELDDKGGTLRDLALELTSPGRPVELVVVCRAGLGTLNHTLLTVEALRTRGLEPAGLVIGAWPDSPGPAETGNRDDLPRLTGVPLLGVIPEGAGSLDREAFLAAATGWLES